ncbi:MAG: S8 family serine peptidase [Alphaproteobacteria bacterium]|nr:S8 family serine peptidase [Alphaproteobacteria bacterium]
MNAAWGSVEHLAEVMVAPIPGVDVAELVTPFGVQPRRAAGPSGYAPVPVPPGLTAEDFLAALAADPRTARVQPSARIEGARRPGATAAYASYQWHLDAAGVDAADAETWDFSAYTVAVIDTGVAYEDHSEGGLDYVAARTLSGSAFVSPYDFVNGDRHANDDNGHGTHITSLIASTGDILGVAPLATIMPLKVLDADAAGTEADLVDAIHHAVDNGADVINLSLSFSADYVPSEAMQVALEAAWNADIPVLAAAGNAGLDQATWPAASPLVLGVGASWLDSRGRLEIADYTNLGPALTLVAPGGRVDDDADGDGYADGLLAESFAAGAPGETGLWFQAGSSQATALATAATLHLLDAGLTEPAEVRTALQRGGQGVRDGGRGVPAEDLVGLDVDGATRQVGHPNCCTSDHLYAMVMPYLDPVSTTQARPAAVVSVVDEQGNPDTSRLKEVRVSIHGADGVTVESCRLRGAGECVVTGDAVDLTGADGDAAALGWWFTVDAVENRREHTLQPVMPASRVRDGLVAFAEALDDEALLDDAVLLWAWDDEVDGVLGRVSASYFLVEEGVRVATRPQAVLLTPAVLDDVTDEDTVEIDLSASGLTTDTLSLIAFSRLQLRASGLTTDTLSFADLSFFCLDASGLTTDTLSLRFAAHDLYTLTGSGLTTDTLSFSGNVLRLDDGSCVDCDLSGYALDNRLASGGWVEENAYGGASILRAAGLTSFATQGSDARSGSPALLTTLTQ